MKDKFWLVIAFISGIIFILGILLLLNFNARMSTLETYKPYLNLIVDGVNKQAQLNQVKQAQQVYQQGR